MDIIVTKEEALAAYNGNATKLAEALKIVPSNVSLWLDGEPIPDRHALRLVFILKREVFKDKIPPPVLMVKREEAARTAPDTDNNRDGEEGSLSE